MNSSILSKLLAAGAASLALVAASSANAAIYELHFTGTGIDGSLVATTNASDTITSITGSFTDWALSPSAYTLTGLSGYAAADNHLVDTPSFVTYSGISFATAAGAGNDFNIFDNGGGNYYLLAQSNDPVGAAYAGMPQLSFAVTAVPEAGSATLLMAGIGLVGIMAARRRAR